jgi:MFS family permease
MVAMFLAAADQTILASALPTIASHLAGFEYLSWVVVAYLLAARLPPRCTVTWATASDASECCSSH